MILVKKEGKLFLASNWARRLYEDKDILDESIMLPCLSGITTTGYVNDLIKINNGFIIEEKKKIKKKKELINYLKELKKKYNMNGNNSV